MSISIAFSPIILNFGNLEMNITFFYKAEDHSLEDPANTGTQYSFLIGGSKHGIRAIASLDRTAMHSYDCLPPGSSLAAHACIHSPFISQSI